MTTYYGVNATEAFVTTGGTVESSKAGGRVRTLQDTFEASAVTAASPVILGGVVLPAGARILPSSTVRHDDLGTGGTIDVVLIATDDATQTSLIADLDVGSAATVEFDDIAYIDTFPAAVAEESYFGIVVADAAATGTIKVDIQYVID